MDLQEARKRLNEETLDLLEQVEIKLQQVIKINEILDYWEIGSIDNG